MAVWRAPGSYFCCLFFGHHSHIPTIPHPEALSLSAAKELLCTGFFFYLVSGVRAGPRDFLAVAISSPRASCAPKPPPSSATQRPARGAAAGLRKEAMYMASGLTVSSPFGNGHRDSHAEPTPIEMDQIQVSPLLLQRASSLAANTGHASFGYTRSLFLTPIGSRMY